MTNRLEFLSQARGDGTDIQLISPLRPVTVTFDPAAYVEVARQCGVTVEYHQGWQLRWKGSDAALRRFHATPEARAFDAIRNALVDHLRAEARP